MPTLSGVNNMVMRRRESSAGPEAENRSHAWRYEGALAPPEPLLAEFLGALGDTLHSYFSGAAVEATLRTIGYRMLAALEAQGASVNGPWRDALTAAVGHASARGVARELTLDLAPEGFRIVARGLAGSHPAAAGQVVRLSPLAALALAATSRAGGTVTRFESGLTPDGAFFIDADVRGA